MSLQSQLTRMAQNVGALTADTNAIFEALRAKGVPVPANAQLSDVADMIEEIEVPPPSSVKIGGRWYPYVQIGNQLWLAENLDYQWDGLKVGLPLYGYEARANYYDNDEATYGINGNKYGLLYNWTAINYLNTNKATLLPESWHIPSEDEWDVLVSSVGGSSVAGTKLKSNTNWINSGNGENAYGFAVFPAGGYWLDEFKDDGKSAYFWTTSLNSSSYPRLKYFTASSSGIKSSANPIDYCYSIRLVKDLA